MSRLAVYVFWERDGIVRDYVITYLVGLTAVADKLYVVVNGKIQPEGRQKIEKETGAIVLQRPNEGVDFWAYKTGLDHEGGGISTYDEVILCNCSCYGPVYPFTEMFEEMGKRDVDFWGITEWPLNAGGYQGTWVLSYFLVFRPHLFLSPEWVYYWKNLSPVRSRDECIEKHETKFTGYFAEKGFTYDVYCPSSPGYLDPTIEAPDELVIDQRCPVIKRKAFCSDYGRFLPYRKGDASRRVFDYVKEHHLYDTDQILMDMLATQHMAYLRDCLQLYYILPDHGANAARSTRRAVICFQMSCEELLDENFQTLRGLPSLVDCYIMAPGTLLKSVREKVVAYGVQNCTIGESIGFAGAIGALLRVSDQLENYDCVCALHDGHAVDLTAHCVNAESRRFATHALLASPGYIGQVLEQFDREPHLGLLSPVNSLHGPYSNRYGQEWGMNYANTVTLLQWADVDVPISETIAPIAPLSGMFWFRPAALKRLLELGIKEDEFTVGNEDGTLYHAVLRSLPYFAQSAGYLSGEIIPVSATANHLVNLSYLYRQDNLALCGSANMTYVPVEVCIGVRGALKIYLKRHLPIGLTSLLSRIYHHLRGK
ncbi:hypothetical protein SDC9_64950 [bioreactor metagenome]|uniref:Rhamnan synthesis protein F n=1 Tax=bioreactor metagenome TaxID=1076179 RepID=A0A644XS06_9ZZZZ